MEIRHYASMFWRWAWLIALVTLVGAAISYWSSMQAPRIYRATTTLMVGQLIERPNPQAHDFNTVERLAQTYAQMVRRQPLLEGTIDTLGMGDLPWEALADQVNASPIAGTELLQISAVSGNPTVAMRIADELARQLILQSPTPTEWEQDQQRAFVQQELQTLETRIAEAHEQVALLETRLAVETSARGIQDIQGQMTALQEKISHWQRTYTNFLEFIQGGRTNQLRVVEPAVASSRPISPNVPLNVLLAASIGLILALAAVLLMEYLDDTIKTREDADTILGLPTLGAVGRMRNIRLPSDGLVAMQDAASPVTEGYRVVRTNLRFLSIRTPQTTLMVSSAVAGEGKTTTACNLAVSMAQAGSRVVLCDGDLRRPTLHQLFNASNAVGLSNLLVDDSLPVQAAIKETAVARLKILTSGPVPPNPSELLVSQSMKRRLAHLKAHADVIIFDSPAALPVADATVLGMLCTGVVLVVDSQRTRSTIVRQAKVLMDQAGLNVIGVVLNNARITPGSYGTYPSSAPVGATHGTLRRIASAWSGLFNAHR